MGIALTNGGGDRPTRAIEDDTGGELDPDRVGSAAAPRRSSPEGRPVPRSHLLLTGAPGVGKTTLVRRLVRAMPPTAAAGFYTEEIRVRGKRRGFRLVALDGSDLVLAHLEQPGPARVGRYGVDVAGFDRLLADLALTDSRTPMIVIDEIGRMECLSSRFREAVVQLLDSSRMVLATIALRGDRFVQEIKQRSDVRLVNVTPQNRDTLVSSLTGEIRCILTPGS